MKKGNEVIVKSGLSYVLICEKTTEKHDSRSSCLFIKSVGDTEHTLSLRMT